MSRMVDERVVELRFNNRDFERNARQTLSTLDRLHSGLDFKQQAKNLATLGNATNKLRFSVLENGIQKVNAQFSAMQVAGITALTNIVNSATNAGKQLVKSLSIDQVTSGYTKYEEKTASVQTIMAATGKTIDEVSAALEKLNWFTDETSYNFVDMTNNIGKFTSAGVDLDVSVTAMEGIATAAALAGQNASTASRVMYNFSQALGTGAVKLQDWMSIENANMATLEFKQTVIDTAVELGVLEKAGNSFKIAGSDIEVTAKTFRETLSEGWFTSDVLLNTLQKYGDYSERVYEVATEQGITCSEAMAQMSTETQTLGEKAFRAAQEAKTFTDAVEATKDAVSTGWMTTFETLFGNYVEAKDTWTELANRLYDIFAESGNARNELLGNAMGSRVALFEQQLEDAGYSVEHFRALVYQNTQKAGIDIQEMFQKYGFYTDAFIQSEELSDIIDKTILGMADDTKQATVDQSKLNEYLDAYNKLLSDVAGKKITDEQAAKIAEKLGISMENLNDEVDWFIESGYSATKTFEDLSDEQLKSIGYTKSEIDSLKRLSSGFTLTTESAKGLVDSLKKPTGRELLIDSLRDALVGLQQVLNIVKNAWTEVFPALTTDRLYTIIERFKSFTENLVLNEENADKLTRTFKGVFSLLDIGAQVIKSIVQNGFNLLKEVLGLTNVDLLDFTASIGDSIVQFDEFLRRTDGVNQFFTYLINLIKTGYGYIKQFIDELLQLPQVNGAVQTVKTAFNDFIKFIGVDTSSATKTFENILNNFKELNNLTFDDVKGAFKEFSNEVEDLTPNLNVAESLETATNEVKAWGEETIGQIKGTFKGAENETTSGIKTFAEAVKDTIKNIDFGGLGLAALGIALLLFTNSLIKNINSLLKTLSPLKELIKALTDTVNKIGKTIKNAIKGLATAAEFMMVGIAIFFIASAISKLAEALKYLVETNPDAVGALVAALAGLVVVALALTLALAKVTKTVDVKLLNSYLTVLIGLAISVGILAASLRLLVDLDPEKIGNAWLGVAASLAVLAGAIVIVNHFGKAMSELAAGKVVGLMLGLATSIALLTASLRLLSGISFTEILEELGGAVVSLIGISLAAKLAGAGEGTIGSILSIAGIIIAFKMLTDLIANFDPKFLAIVRGNIEIFVIIVAALTTFSKYLSKGIKNVSQALNDTAKYAAKIGLMIIEVAAAILLLTVAIKAMVKLSENTTWQDLLKGGGIVAGLLLLMSVLEYFSKQAAHGRYAVRVGGMALMIAAAVTALSFVVAALGRIDADVLAKGVGVVSTLLILFTFMLQIAKFEKSTENGYKSLWALMTTLGVVLVAVGILGQLSKDGAKIPEILIAVSALFIAIGTSLKQMQANVNSLDLGRLAAQIIVVTGAVALIAGLLAVLQSKVFDQNQISSTIETAASISIILYAMAKAIEVINKVGNNPIDPDKLGSLLLMVSGLSLLSLFLSVVITGLTENLFKNGFDIKNILVVIGAVGLLLTEVAAMYFVINKLFGGKKTKIDKTVLDNLKFMTGIVAALSALMVLLAAVNININEALAGAAGVQLLLLELGVGAWLFAKLPNKKIVKNAQESIWFLVGIMTALTLLVAVLSKIDSANVIPNTLALTGLLAVLVGMTAILMVISKIPVKGKDLVNVMLILVGVTSVAYLCTGIIAILQQFDGDEAIKQVKALTMVLVALGALAVAAGVAGRLAAGSVKVALVGIGIIVVLALATAGLLDLIGWLTDDAQDNILTKGATVVGEAIGSFIGAIVDGFGRVAGGQLTQLVQNVQDFATAVSTMADIDTTNFVVFATFADSINTLSKTDVEKFNEKANKLNYYLPRFGEAILAFSNSLGDLPTDSVDRMSNAAELCTKLVDIANALPNSGGLWGLIVGNNDFKTFIGDVDEDGNSDLSKFGTAIATFANTVANLNYDETKIDQVSDVALTLAGVQTAFKSNGGLQSWIFGDAQTWDSINKGIPGFGAAVKTFCETMSGLTDSQVNDVKQTVPVVKALSAMVSALKDVDLKNLPEITLPAGVKKNVLGQTVPVFETYKSVWLTLSNGLPEFIESMKTAAEKTKDFTDEDLASMKTFFDNTKQAYEIFYGLGSNYSSNVAYNWYEIQTNVEYLADAMDALSVAVKDVADNKTKASDFYQFMALLLDSFNKMPDKALANLSNLVDSLETFGETITDSADWIEAVNTNNYALVGRNIMAGIISGMDEYMGEVGQKGVEAGETVLEGTRTATDTRSPSRKMAEIGRWLDIGLAHGITDNLKPVKTAAEGMGYAAENSIRDVLGVHSESTLFNEIASWCGPGFASGLEEGWGVVKEKLSGLGSGVMDFLGIDTDALKNTVSKIVGETGLSFDSLSDALGINAEAFDLTNFNFDDFGAQLEALTGNVDSLTFSLNANAEALDKVKERLAKRTSDLAEAQAELQEVQDEIAQNEEYINPVTGEKSHRVTADQSRRLDFWTKRIAELEQAIARDQTAQSELEANTDSFESLLADAKASLDSFKTEYGGLADEAYNQALEQGNAAMDKLIEKFGKGKVSAKEFSESYNAILQQYQVAATEIIPHTIENMTDYITDGLQTAADNLESTFEDIKSKMDDAAGNVSKSYEDIFTFKTNKDIFDEKVDEYNKQIEKTEALLNRTKRQYGENAAQVKQYQTELDNLQAELDDYQDWYKVSDFDDNEIVRVDIDQEIANQAEKIREVEKMAADLRKSGKLGLDQDAIFDFAAGLTIDEQKALYTKLGEMTQEDIQTMEQNLQDISRTSENYARTLYLDPLKRAEEDYKDEVYNLIDNLPPEFKELGKQLLIGWENGFTEETENLLKQIGTTGDDLINAARENLGIHSPSQVAKEKIGYPIADGIAEQLQTKASEVGETIRNTIASMFGVASMDETEEPYLLAKFREIINAIKTDLLTDDITSPKITPVLDLTTAKKQASQLNSMFSYGAANAAAWSMSWTPSSSFTDASNPNTTGTNNGVIINQNNYSPKALDAREIYMNTKAAVQLVHNLGWKR